MRKEKEDKEKICEHSWLPVTYSYDRQVFGVGDEEEVFMENDIIIVQCTECGKVGYIMGKRVEEIS